MVDLLEYSSGCSYFYVRLGVTGARNDDMAKRKRKRKRKSERQKARGCGVIKKLFSFHFVL